MIGDGVSLPCVITKCDFRTIHLEYSQSYEQLLTHLKYSHAAGSDDSQEQSAERSSTIQDILDIIRQEDQVIRNILCRRNSDLQEIVKAAKAEVDDKSPEPVLATILLLHQDLDFVERVYFVFYFANYFKKLPPTILSVNFTAF